MVTRATKSVLALTLLAFVAGATALPEATPAQPAPVRLPGTRVGPARTTPTLPAKEVKKAPRLPRTKPKVDTAAKVPTLPKPGEGLDPQPGVIKTGGGGELPEGFDPAKLGEKKPEEEEAEDDERGIEDMIVFNSNYERGIKCRKLPLDTQISIDFENAPLEDVLKFIGCITAKNFIVGKALGKGKTITIMSPEPVTAYEAYKVFLLALEMNGLTVVPAGKFLKIVEMGAAKQDTIPILGDKARVPDDSRLVTRIIRLEHTDASELQAILGKFKTKHGDITVYAPSNTIFLTDIAANIRRLLRLVKELDVPTGTEKVWIRKIEYAEANGLVDKLMGIFGPQGSGSTTTPKTTRPSRSKRSRSKKTTTTPTTPTTVGEATDATVTKILADERTNQLIIVATPTAYYRLDKLIRRLDVPIPGEGAIHIHYLENADAEELSQTLSSLVSGTGSSARKTTKKTTKKSGGGAAALFEGDVRISAHKPTNALIIQASLKDYMSLKTVIDKLDSRRKQVYVEAIIMEVSSSKDRDFGVSGSGGTTFDVQGETVPLMLGMGGLGISGLDSSQLSKGGMALGLQGPLLDVSAGSGTGDDSLSGTLSIPSFGFLLQAIQSNSDVNILSTPHILTTDNEEAEIQVGKQIPYMAQSGYGGLSSLAGLSGLGGVGGSSSLSRLGGLGGLGGYSSMLSGMGGMVQRIDVDLTLKITPHVNEGNYVRLETDLQIDDVESIDRTLGPTTSKRHVTNVVVVRDQQPVVIGGLIRDTESEAVDKIPLLGDIPLLGILFRQTTTRIEKKNLLMIIIPHIIDDPGVDLKRIHEQRIEEMRRFSEYMATRKKEYLGEIDYAKKHGAMEEIRQTVDRARKDREAMERALFDESEMDTIGPPETHDIEYDPYEAAKPVEPSDELQPPADDEAPVAPPGAAVPPAPEPAIVPAGTLAPAEPEE